MSLEILQKRWKLLLLLVILLSIVFAPYVVGYFFQNTAEKDLKLFASDNPNIKLVNYQRGIFSSTAILNINNTLNALKVKVQIFHGPYLFLYQGKLGEQPYFGLAKAHYSITGIGATQDKLNKYIGTQELLTGQIVFDFNGNAVATYRSAVVSYFNNEQNFVLNWSGFSGQLVLNAKDYSMKNHININGIAISNPYGNLNINSGAITSTGQQQTNGVWLHSLDFNLDKIEVTSKNTPYITLNDLIFEAKSSINNNNLEYRDRLSIKKLRIDNNDYAPSYSTTTIKQIPLPAYQQFINTFNVSANNVAVKDTQTEVKTNNFWSNFFDKLQPLIDSGAKLNKYLEIITPEGKIMANLDVYEDNVEGMLPRFKATLQIIMPRPILETIVTTAFSNSTEQMKSFKKQQQDIVKGATPKIQMQNFIAEQINQEYITVDGNNCILDFTLQDEEYRLNGKPIDISFLLIKTPEKSIVSENKAIINK